MENYRTTDKPTNQPPPPQDSVETLFRWKLCVGELLEDMGMPCIYHTLQILGFAQTDVSWQPYVKQAFRPHFSLTGFGRVGPPGCISRTVTIYQAFSSFYLL